MSPARCATRFPVSAAVEPERTLSFRSGSSGAVNATVDVTAQDEYGKRES
jgi:hypothetical protein